MEASELETVELKRIMEQGILPPPLTVIEEALDDSNRNLPGEIKLDTHGRMLKRYLTYRSPTSFLVEIYDDWLARKLPQQIAARIATLADGSIIRYDNVDIVSPTYTEGGERVPLTPYRARRNGLTYSIIIRAQAVNEMVTPEGVKEIARSAHTILGEVPLMLGSSYCYLRGKTADELVAMGEDPYDAFGYFVVAGDEKVLLMQEQLRVNRMLLFNISGKDQITCRMTIPVSKGTVLDQVVMGKHGDMKFILDSLNRDSNKKAKRGDKREVIVSMLGSPAKQAESNISIDSLKKESTKKTRNGLNGFVLLNLLGMADASQIYAWIRYMTKEDWATKVMLQFIATEAESDRDPINYTARLLGMIDTDKVKYTVEEKQERISKMLEDDVFPHMNDMPPGHKAPMALLMMVRMAEYKAGYRGLDDRDAWSNKRLESAGRLCEQLWHMLHRSAIRDNQKTIDRGNATDLDSFIRTYKPSIITDGFFESFNTTNWGVKGVSLKPNVSQSMKRDNRVAQVSHAMRIDVNTTRHDKQQTIRMVQMSQYGYVCAAETPEGGSCGVIKNLSMTAFPTIDQPPDKVIYALNTMNNGQPAYELVPSAERRIKLLVDGKFLGFCQGQDTYDKLLAIKHTNAFPMGTAIVLIKDDILEVHTDGSRLVRPLAIVGSNGRLEIENKKLWGASTGVLLKQGCLEYVDAYEQEFIKLASSLDTLRFRTESLAKAREAYDKAEAELNSVKGGGRVTYSMMKDGLESTATLTLEEADKRLEQARFALDKLVRSRPYTHCEIDPQAILGISASLIPHPNHIQAPRNNYQSAMGKQALGVYHVHHMDRFDGKTKVLAFPSRPMFETQMAEMLGLNANPQGDTLMVAFGTKSGMTAEDSFVVNQNTVDMGHFRILRTISIRTTVKNTAEVIEQLGRPQLKKDEKAERYQFLGENGLPAIGAYLKQGDAVVGKRQIILASRDERNTSVFLKVGEEGIVRKVYVTGDESSLVVNVKLVMFRTPVEGDKFAPRYAQKGTWSYICPAEDMYFTESGEAIDMLVNPHAIPSRMTMTYIFELIATKAGVLTGDRINATAFRPFDYDEFQRILRLYGYSPQGLEVVYSGTLGTELQVQLYHGPCYIQALKHHVKDKHQVRGKGAVKAVNRQPVKGRLHGGGLRFGEMERDNAAGHGAAYFLQERLCTVSDAYQVIFCTNCGTFALTDIIGQDYTCKHCTVKGQFGRATIPYALKLLFHYLAAAGIFLRFDLKTLDEYREYQEMRARRAASATGLPEDEEEEVIEEGEEEQEEDEHTIDEDESY